MDLEQVNDMAKQVAAEHNALDQAKHDKEVAEDALLAKVVDAIRPALPAMSTKVDPSCAGPIARAVCVDKQRALYLGEQGDWFVLHTMPGENRPRVLSIVEVLNDFDLVTIIVSLVQSLRSQLGSRDKSVIRIQEETARLEALVTLLTPVRR